MTKVPKIQTHYEYRTTDPRCDTECLVQLSDWQTENPNEFTVMRDGAVWVLIGANCAETATGDDDLFVKLLVDDEQSARLQTMPSIHRGWPDFKLIREDIARRYPDYQLLEGVDGEN